MADPVAVDDMAEFKGSSGRRGPLVEFICVLGFKTLTFFKAGWLGSDGVVEGEEDAAAASNAGEEPLLSVLTRVRGALSAAKGLS